MPYDPVHPSSHTTRLLDPCGPASAFSLCSECSHLSSDRPVVAADSRVDEHRRARIRARRIRDGTNADAHARNMRTRIVDACTIRPRRQDRSFAILVPPCSSARTARTAAATHRSTRTQKLQPAPFTHHHHQRHVYGSFAKTERPSGSSFARDLSSTARDSPIHPRLPATRTRHHYRASQPTHEHELSSASMLRVGDPSHPSERASGISLFRSTLPRRRCRSAHLRQPTTRAKRDTNPHSRHVIFIHYSWGIH